MLMIYVRKCKNCGKQFLPKHNNHFFCHRKCFWEYRNKLNKLFPSFICENCGIKIILNFYPKKDKKKWYNFVCPNCGRKVSDYYNDFKKIEELKIKFKEELIIDLIINKIKIC